jgi:hypothetical protein
MGREAYHTSLHSAEDKNGGAIPPLLLTSSWHMGCESRNVLFHDCKSDKGLGE